jgi:hypothetical protein
MFKIFRLALAAEAFVRTLWQPEAGDVGRIEFAAYVARHVAAGLNVYH